MKKFLLFTLKTILILGIIAIALDYCYTYVFLQSKNRGKIETVFNAAPQNYDIVILGSSRANNHFISQMFEQKGLKTFNYGMSGGHLFEASLMLKLMLERNYIIKNIILEADLNLANEKEAEGIAALFLPYIHNSETIEKHFASQENFNELYYMPFYRYIKYDTKIGLRETFFAAIHKKTNSLDNQGYHPLEKHKNAKMKNDIIHLNPLPHNKYYEEIKQLCKVNNINFIAVMTPMCENTKGMDYFDKVHKIYPEIFNYEGVVKEDKYFSSCGHMNDKGAQIFTARIINDFFIQ